MGSTSEPPALLVYSLQRNPADSTTHLLRFLFGNPDIVEIVLGSVSATGWSPSAGLHVPFQIAGGVQVIPMNFRFPYNHGVSETSLILTKALLEYIENLPIKEGRDVDWALHGSLLSECIPGRRRWDQKIGSTFGMRYTLLKVVHLRGKPMVIIGDICPRRCLRVSEEERQESEQLRQVLMNSSHRTDQPYPRLILKSVPLPKNIRFPESARLMISDDGVVALTEVCHKNVYVFLAARLMPLSSTRLGLAVTQFICLRSDKSTAQSSTPQFYLPSSGINKASAL